MPALSMPEASRGAALVVIVAATSIGVTVPSAVAISSRFSFMASPSAVCCYSATGSGPIPATPVADITDPSFDLHRLAPAPGLDKSVSAGLDPVTPMHDGRRPATHSQPGAVFVSKRLV
jgi:hypothetical protein